MSGKWRRFDVLLPLQFHDGRAVPPERLAPAVFEVVDHFGARGQRRGNCQRPHMISPIGRISQIGRIGCGGWLMFRPFGAKSRKRNSKTGASG